MADLADTPREELDALPRIYVEDYAISHSHGTVANSVEIYVRGSVEHEGNTLRDMTFLFDVPVDQISEMCAFMLISAVEAEQCSGDQDAR